MPKVMVGGKNTFETENILHNILSTYFHSNVPFSGKEEPTTATGEEADAVHRRLLKVGLLSPFGSIFSVTLPIESNIR